MADPTAGGTVIPEYIPYTNPLVTDSILPLLIGIYISFTLFGVNLIQFFHIGRILRQSTSNELWNWVVLGGFFVLDVTDQIFKAVFFSQNIRGVATRGQAAAFYPSPRSIVSLGVFGGLIPLAVHCFYIKRIHQISRTWRYRYLVWVFLSLCLATSIVALVYGVLSGIVGMRKAIDYFPDIKKIPVPWLAGDAAVDGALCFILITYLASQRTEFQDTNRLLARWIAITIETGLIPAAFALADLLLALKHPDKTYHFAVNFVLSKAYVACVLFLFWTVTKNKVSGNSSSHASGGPRYISSKGVSANARAHMLDSQASVAESPSHQVTLDTHTIEVGRPSYNDKEKYYP